MRSIIIPFIMCVLLCFPVLADTKVEAVSYLTDAEKQWIKNQGTIRVANETDWPPFDFSESGIPKGLSIDYIIKLADKVGLKLEFINGFAWTELIDLFKQRKIDVMPVFYHNKEREAFTLYTEPYYRGKLGIFTNTDAENIDLLNRKVGMETSHGSIPIVKEQIPGIRIIEVDSKTDLVRQLATKQLDAIIGNPFVFYYIARESQIENIQLSRYLKLSKEEQAATSFHIGVRKDWPILHRILQKAMAHMSTEEMNQIKDKWADIKIVEQTNWILIAQVFGAILLVVLFLFWNNRILKTMVRAKTQELASLNEELELKVDARTKELLELTKKLEQKVDERTVNFKKAKEEAEQANRLKSEFLANISHELRTPMHHVLSYAQIGIRRIDAPQNRTLECFNIIISSSNKLMDLINNLFDLSKLEAGRMEYAFMANDVFSIVNDNLARFKQAFEEKKITVKMDQPSIPTKVICDRITISQVIQNLLDNSIRFTPENKSISISFESKEVPVDGESDPDATLSSLQVAIKDAGPGIPDDELEYIFDRFVQSSRTKTGAGGTGLGLAICQKIIDDHHGHIWVENSSEGGATFIFEIPYQPSK